MPRQQPLRSPGFTLVELLVIVAIIAVTAAILFPVFHHPHTKRDQMICFSNEKQILLGMIGYSQDNDGRFPTVANVVNLPDGTQTLQLWGPSAIHKIAQGDVGVPGLIYPYIKNDLVFQCPSIQEPNSPLQQRMNDLAAGANQAEMPGITQTILLMDGEDTLLNFGHSVARSDEDLKPAYLLSPKGTFTLVIDGAVSAETLGRHGGGCNYGLADGHVKWYKNTPGTIYFPPRGSHVVSHIDPRTKQANAPDPGGNMTYQGNHYAATFHIR